MARIFISHSSGDNAAALAIAQWLADSGWDDYFLDITPERGLAPGERWQAALKAAADRCEAVLFLISPSWQRSRWCLAEFLLAKQLGKAIFGVLIESTPLDHLPEEMTSEWQLCDLVQGSEQRTYSVEQPPHVARTDIRFASAGLDRLRIGLQRAGLDPATFPWPPASEPERSPYPGLRALEAEDAAVLFGRDAMIVRGLDQLRRTRERGIEHLFVIVGASGAGKSSFMRAGLLPRLARDDRQFLPLPVIRPERAAINGREGLIACLERAFKARGANRSRAQLRGALEQPLGLAGLLREFRDARPRMLEDAGTPPTLVIPIDQGEELFAADAGAEGGALVAHLGPLVSADAHGEEVPHTIVLGSIRADSLDLMQSQPSLQNLPTVLFNLPPVARGEFKGVIEGPAARHTASGRKLTIDPALTEHLMADAEGADAMPLLALTLERLYLEHGADGALTLEGYEHMGGLRGSIEAAVEAAFAEPSLPPTVPEESRERLELLRVAFVPWLASVDPDTGERKRRVARWEDIPESSRPLIDRLVRQRLLIKDRRRVREGEPESIVVEVAHEALIRQWPPLRGWLDEEEADLRNLEGVRRAAAEWTRNDADAEWLVHTGERLDDAEALMRWPDFKAMLGEEGVAYLVACRKRDNDARAEREAQLALISRQQAQVEEEQLRTAAAQRRTARFQRWTNIALAGVAVVLAGTGWWIVKQTRDVALQTSFVVAQNAERVSDSYLTVRSVPQTGRALRLALVAAHSSALAPAHPAAELQVSRAAQALRGVQIVELPRDQVRRAVLTPDGAYLMVNDSRAGTVQLWDAASGAAIAKVSDLEGRNRQTFGPDGARVVSWGGKLPPLLWEARTGRIIAELQGHDGNVVEANILAGGRRLVTRAQRGAPRLWDMSDGRLVATLEGHAGSPALRLAADGTRIATYRGQEVPLLWDAATGKLIAKLAGHEHALTLTLSEDGTRLVTHSSREATRLWDMTSGTQLADLGAPSRWYRSPDDARLVTVSSDGVIRLWDGTDGREIAVLAGADGDRLRQLSFSADGKRLLLKFGDNAFAVRDAADGRLLTDLSGDNSIQSASFGRDGALLFTRSEDGQQMRDSATGKTLLSFERRTALTFDPTGAYLIASVKDGTPQLWSTAGRFVADLAGHTGQIRHEFSPDGARLLTTDESAVARLWDTATGSVIATLPGHSGTLTVREFSPDGTRLLTRGSDNEPRLWDATTGQLLAVLSGHTQKVLQSKFSRDGRRVLTLSEDDTARIWQLAPPRATLYRGTHPISRAAMTPDGGRLAVASGRSIQLLALAEGKTTTTVERPMDEILFAVPGLGMVTRFGPNAVRLMDTDKGRVRSTLVGHSDRILGASMSLDRKLVGTASADRTARIWEADTGKLVYVLEGHEGAVEGVAFSLDGKLIATRAADHVARIWDAKSGRRVAAFSGHKDAITLIAFATQSPRVVTASADRSARVWDAVTRRAIATLAPHPAPLRSAFLTPDGARAVTVAGRVALVWDAVTGKRLREIDDGGEGFLFANLDGKGDRVITVGLAGDLRVWEVASGKEIARFPGSTHPFRAGLDEKGEQAAAVSKEGLFRLWDVASRTLKDSKSTPLTINALALDPLGKRVLVGWSDGMVRLHDAATGKPVLSYLEHEQPITAAAFAPGGDTVVTASADGAMRLWKVESGKTLRDFARKEGAVVAIAFSPDGSLLAVATDRWDRAGLLLLDAGSGREIGALTGHASFVDSVAFSADGTRLVTTSRDRTARVWDVATRQTVAIIEGLDANVRAATFDAGATRLVITSADRSSQVWDIAAGKLLAQLDDGGSPAGFAAFAPDGESVITASRGGAVREWGIGWLARAHDATLAQSVCKERLLGASSIVTAADVRDAPLLTGRIGEDACAGFR